MFDNTDIIITSSINKKALLKEFSSSLKNIKIYTISEFNRLFYYDYDSNANLYIMNKYNVIYEISDIYLKNLTYINNQTYTSPKLQFLSNLKQDLLDNKLLKINKLFRKSLDNKNIVIYNLGDTKEINLLVKDLSSSNVTIINDQDIKYKDHKVYELKTIEDEVVYVASSICDLIQKGIDIKNIYLTNLNDEYFKLIRRIFPMFNIPFTLKDNASIYGTSLVSKFLSIYSNNINETMTSFKEMIDETDSEGEEIYNQVLDIVNKYAFVNNYDEVLPLIIYDLKNTKLKKEDIINSVHESKIDDVYKEDDYVFLLSFNQGIIPVIHKDESYLTDRDALELGTSLVVEKNITERNKTILNISNIKNLIITYKREANGELFNVSNIINELNYETIKPFLTYNYSNLYNQIRLTSLRDTYNKYGTTSDTLFLLNTTYKDLPYNTYNHDFTGINKQDLHKYLKDYLSLSYTKVDNYFKCPFSYYINYILQLNIYEDTFYQKIGTLFHAILEKFNETDKSFEELWQEETSTYTELTNQEIFFLDKLKSELEFVINTLKEQETYTDLHNELHEEKVYTSISGDMKISFSGIVDKIKYKEEDDKTVIAIIDYKTGTPSLDLSTIPYGIGMQLPVYLYLAKNSDKLKNIKVAGFYLQHILNNEITVEKGEDYNELKKKSLLLQGYSNDNVAILSTFDKSYENSKIIKSMKTNKDGSFSHYAKILSSENMAKLTDIAENKIIEAANRISNAEFNIAPKKIGDTNYGCKYCKYKDICFHTNEDIEELPELSAEDIFGGEL